MAKGTVSAAKATDQVEASFTQRTPAPEPTVTQSPSASVPEPEPEPTPTPVHRILDPSHAIAEIKSKVGTLTTVVHNVGHYSTLAFDEVEALAADIAKLSNFIRTKV
jgi:hypothetical protein